MEDFTDLELGGARRRLRVLVVDDEPLGRRRIQDLLEDQPDIEVIGTAADGVAAIEAIRTRRPDLVFLDVQMPRMSGLDVVQTVGPAEMPTTVFVTAHDEYALNAFDAAAVDYLVKPFKDDRFVEAVRRARRYIDFAGRERLHEQLLALLHGGATPLPVPPPPGESPRRLERIAVRMSGKTRVVPVRRIDYITADGPYAELHVGPDRYVIRESMHNLEEQLDSQQFVRIHRSVIVQVDRIEALLRSEGSEYHVQLKGGIRLRVGRSRREALERRLGTPH
jgi:two-component system, LytTR family, response regulator